MADLSDDLLDDYVQIEAVPDVKRAAKLPERDVCEILDCILIVVYPNSD